MRILRVRILNLNSLRGEHVVDFTREPLANHQLYAIVGPTGAGKTTILDAITLALYGRTERSRDDKDTNPENTTVMTYGTAECAAELEYETAKGRFRSVWTQQRAHRKTNGRLQGNKHRIERIELGGDDTAVILEEKKSKVPKRTEKIVGLDYERFIRSAMLTQGEFARFLKSSAGEKGEILEKITGTDIYKQLSKAAFQRHKLAAEALDRSKEALNANPPMAGELRTQLEEDLERSEREIGRQREQLAAALTHLSQHAELGKLEARKLELKLQKTAAEEAWRELSPDRNVLTDAESVAPLAPALESVARLRKEQLRLDERLEVDTKSLTTLAATAVNLTERTTTARKALLEFRERLPAREKKCSDAAALERKVEVLVSTTEVFRRQLEEKQREAKKLTVSSEANKTAIEKITRELGGLSGDEIDAKAEALAEELRKRRANDTRLVTWLEVAKLSAEISAQKEEMAAIGRSRTAHRAASIELEKTALAARKHLDERIVVRNSYRLQHGLKQYKADLKEGDPCPVCGATDHPALEHFVEVTDGQLLAIEAEVVAAREALTGLQEKLTEERTREEANQQSLARAEAATKKLEEQLATISRPLGKEETDVTQIRQLISANQRTLATSEGELQRLRGLQKDLPDLRRLETTLAGELKQLAGLDKMREELTGQIAGHDAKLLAHRTEIKELLGGDHDSEHCRRLLINKEKELTDTLAAAEGAAIRAETETAAAKQKLAEGTERRQTLAGELVGLDQQLTHQLALLSLSEDQAKARLLTIAATMLLREKLVAADRHKDLTTSSLERLIKEYKEQGERVAKLESETELRNQQAALEASISQAEQSRGAITEQLRQDDARLRKIADLKDELDHLRGERNRWARLNDLIGSADGKKFRSYAQAITLQRLIDIGNDHLERINPRYRMEYEAPDRGRAEELSMIIIDLYQNDNRRTMATLSGGESFLISLALALGLSDLASGKSLIQSLFIDEGFGTLDGKTLDQAMTTLEGLQAQGKTIGLISHVPALKERIPCRIVVEPVGEGFSTVRFVG